MALFFAFLVTFMAGGSWTPVSGGSVAAPMDGSTGGMPGG